MEEMVNIRTRELAEALARLQILDQSKSDFLRLIAHEFRTPLNGILGVAELILAESQSASSEGLRQAFMQSRARVLVILDHALLLTQIDVEGGKFVSQRVSLAAVLGTAVEQATEYAARRQVTFEWVASNTALILGRHDLLVTAFRALLETAVKFAEPGEMVRIARDSCQDAVQIAIQSRGRSVPAETIAKFFDVFAVASSGGNLGLDPAVAQRILALFGGSVTIQNRHPSGIQLTVTLKQVIDA